MQINASLYWREWNGHNYYIDKGDTVFIGYSLKNIPLPTTEKFMLIDYVKVE